MDLTSATAIGLIVTAAIGSVASAVVVIINAVRAPAQEAERDRKAEALHADAQASLDAAVQQSVAATTKVNAKLDIAHTDLVTRSAAVDVTLNTIQDQTNGNLHRLQGQLKDALTRIEKLEELLQAAITERRVRINPPVPGA